MYCILQKIREKKSHHDNRPCAIDSVPLEHCKKICFLIFFLLFNAKCWRINKTQNIKKKNVINNIDFVFSLPSCLSIFNADVAFV